VHESTAYSSVVTARRKGTLRRFAFCALYAFGFILASFTPFSVVYGQSTPGAPRPIARVLTRITSAPADRTISGVLVALDSSGQPVTNLTPDELQAAIDGQPHGLTLAAARPSIALAAAFLFDSTASPLVRSAVSNALAEALQGVDANRDTVAIVSTSDARPWSQATFTTSASDLNSSLNRVIQVPPDDNLASLEQVSGILQALAAQSSDVKVLLLITNTPLAGAASAAATLGTVRASAIDNAVELGIVALSGAGGQGVAEALAEATAGGRVEYALDATNRTDLTRRLELVVAPAFGARRFELPAPADGVHTLTISPPGGGLAASSSFSVSTPPARIDALIISAGALEPGTQIGEPTWVQAQLAEAVPIDSVEWTVDGRVTSVTGEPWALLLDPEQLGEGQHELAARVISQGRAGPLFTTDVFVPADVLRSIRVAVRSWGLIALLFAANVVALLVFVRAVRASRGPGGNVADFAPTLRLNQLAGRYVAPELIVFPTRGKLRVGYHPPYMDNHVGSREFSKLPYQDVRGDDDAVKDLSRHVACIWRDARTNDCYVQLGWPGPGEPLTPKAQTQVFHFGRLQDATSEPFRLAHHDIVRMASGIEFVFYQVGLRDKATPESKKLSPFQGRPSRSTTPISVLDGESRRHTQDPETNAEEG
jgi:hypothetical protein